MAGDRKLTVRFLGQDAGLTKGVKQLVSEMDAAESAGKRAALAIDFMTDAAVQGSREAAAATDALSMALGQETVEAIERAGGSVDKWVGELKKAGLTYQEVADDADALAASIRRAEDANGTFRPLSTSADDAATSVRRLGTDADQSRSVLANMVGNSLQDIGALGGVAGTAGVAIGQLGEYAADGNIKLGNLVGLVGPMAGLGLATVAVGKAVETAAENARIAKEQTQLWLDLQQKFDTLEPPDLAPDAEAFVDQYQGTIDALEQLGYSVSDFVAITRGGGLGVLDELNARQAELADKVANSVDGLRALTDAEMAEYDVLTSLTPNLAGYNEAQANAVTTYDKRKRQSDEMKAALEAEYAATSAASGATSRAASVSQAAATATGVLLNQLELYKDSLNEIPETTWTEIQAAIDEGDLERAEQLLDQAARTRTVTFQVQLDTRRAVNAAAAANSGLGVALGADIAKAFTALATPSGPVSFGGGGGGGSSAPEDPMLAYDQAIGNLFDTGQTSLANYRQYLQGRLSAYETFSNEYKTIWSRLRDLDRIETDAAKEAAEAEKRKQEEAKRAAEEQTKLAEKQLDALRQLLDLLTGFASADAGNLAQPGNIIGSGATGSLNAGQLGGLIADLLRFYQEGVS